MSKPFSTKSWELFLHEAGQRVLKYIEEHPDEKYEYYCFDFTLSPDGDYSFGRCANPPIRCEDRYGTFFFKAAGALEENEQYKLMSRMLAGEKIAIKTMTENYFIWSSTQYFNPYFPLSANRNAFVEPFFDF